MKTSQKLKLADSLWEFAFHSSFIDGHWHSDLHMGNILCLDNKIGIIDFGLTGRLKGFQKSILLNYNTHIVKKEYAMASRLYVSKMINKIHMDQNTKNQFIHDITNILEKNFHTQQPDIMKSVTDIDTCSQKYGTTFNNKYATFELAFSTMASTMVELGHNNIYEYMRNVLTPPPPHVSNTLQ